MTMIFYLNWGQADNISLVWRGNDNNREQTEDLEIICGGPDKNRYLEIRLNGVVIAKVPNRWEDRIHE